MSSPVNESMASRPLPDPVARAAELRSKASHWRQDAEFCAECGAILPLPDQLLNVVCRLCNASWKAGNIDHKVVSTYSESFTKAHESEATSGKADGPEVDRICSHCGHDKMTYSTRQTRSADEGMTVFFKCTKCAKQDIEYS